MNTPIAKIIEFPHEMQTQSQFQFNTFTLIWFLTERLWEQHTSLHYSCQTPCTSDEKSRGKSSKMSTELLNFIIFIICRLHWLTFAKILQLLYLDLSNWFISSWTSKIAPLTQRYRSGSWFRVEVELQLVSWNLPFCIFLFLQNFDCGTLVLTGSDCCDKEDLDPKPKQWSSTFCIMHAANKDNVSLQSLQCTIWFFAQL